MDNFDLKKYLAEDGNRSFKPKLDKMVDYDYSLLVKRRLPKI